MYPVLFTINEIAVRALPVFMVLGLIVFGINLWKETRNTKNLAFDLFLLNIILNPIVARITHVLLDLSNYQGVGWSFLPLKDSGEGLEFFTTFPWIFLSFWEKGTNYQFLPLVLILSVFVLVLFRKEKFFALPLIEIWKGFMMGFVIILFGYFLDGVYLSNVTDFPLLLRYKGQAVDLLPIHLVEIILLLFGLIFYLDTFSLFSKKSRDRFKVYFFPIYWACVQIGLWFFMASYSKDVYVFDIAQIIWIGVIVVFILPLLPFSESIINELFRRKGRGGEIDKPQSRNWGRVSASSDYNYSYSNYKKGHKTHLSPREKFKQTRNRLKRGV